MLSSKRLAYKRPTPSWNDAALKGFENFMTGLWLQENERLLAGFRKGFKIAVNFPSIACFALRNSLFHGEQGITA